ncbi:O180 family O-antigen polymerase [Escherichia coli]
MFNALPGGILIYYTNVTNSVLDKVTAEYRIMGLYLILYMMIAFPLGLLFIKSFFFKVGDIGFLTRYQNKPLVGLASTNDAHARVMLTLLTGGCALSLLYVTWSVGNIPQLSFIYHMTHDDILRIRVENSRHFNGLLFIKTIFFEQLTPLLSLVVYAFYRQTKKRYDKLLFVILFIMSLYTVTFSLSKSTLVVYLAFFIFMRIYLNGRIPVMKFFIAAAILFILLIFMFFIVTDQSTADVIVYLLNRMFIDQVSGLYLMLQLFPQTYPFIGVDSLSSILSSLMGAEFVQPSTRLAMEYAFPTAVAEGKMNLLSTLFIGEAWANFGWLGVAISPLYVGIITGFIYYFVLSKRKTPLLIGLLTYCSFGTNFSSQLNMYIYNSVMISLILALGLIYFISVLAGQLSKR